MLKEWPFCSIHVGEHFLRPEVDSPFLGDEYRKIDSKRALRLRDNIVVNLDVTEEVNLID